LQPRDCKSIIQQTWFDLKKKCCLEVIKIDNKLKILQTGKGNVAKGSMEIFKHANIEQISLNDYLNKKYELKNFEKKIQNSTDKQILELEKKLEEKEKEIMTI